MNTYKVSKRFIQDHCKRGCLREDDGSGWGPKATIASVVTKETKTYYLVILSDTQAKELLSDAQYYALYSDQSDIGLRSSARATYKALLVQGVMPKEGK